MRMNSEIDKANIQQSQVTLRLIFVPHLECVIPDLFEIGNRFGAEMKISHVPVFSGR